MKLKAPIFKARKIPQKYETKHFCPLKNVHNKTSTKEFSMGQH